MERLVIRNRENTYDAKYAKEDADKSSNIFARVDEFLEDIKTQANLGKYSLMAQNSRENHPIFEQLKKYDFKINYLNDSLVEISW